MDATRKLFFNLKLILEMQEDRQIDPLEIFSRISLTVLFS